MKSKMRVSESVYPAPMASSISETRRFWPIAKLRDSFSVELTIFPRNSDDTLDRHRVERSVAIRRLTRREAREEATFGSEAEGSFMTPKKAPNHGCTKD